MPLGRFQTDLIRKNEREGYMQLLRESLIPHGGRVDVLPPTSVDGMARFMTATSIWPCASVNHGAPDHIRSFRPKELRTRRIVTENIALVAPPGQGPPAAEHWYERTLLILSLKKREAFVFLPLQGEVRKGWGFAERDSKQVRNDILFLVMLLC